MKGLLAISKARKEEQAPPIPVNKKSKKPKANFNIQNYLNSQEQSFSISQSNSASNKTTERSDNDKNKLLERKPDEKSPMIQNSPDIDDEPPQQQIIAYAQMIGIRLPEEAYLLNIAKQGLMAELPDDWDFEETLSGEILYFNKLTNKKSAEHPLDQKFRKRVVDERMKKYEIEQALSKNKLNPIAVSAKTTFIKNPFGANPDMLNHQQKSQNKSNFTLNQIIEKNTEKSKNKLNFLYGESDEEEWHPEEQDDDEPASIFFNRSKSIKNFNQENESKLKNSVQAKSIAKKFEENNEESKIRKGLAIKISKQLPQNQVDVEEVPKPQLMQKQTDKNYFDRINSLFALKESDRVQKQKNEISDRIHQMFQNKMKEIDEQQLIRIQKLRQMNEHIQQNDLATLIREVDDMEITQNENSILKELICNPQCNIYSLREQLPKRKKQIERRLLKEHSERVHKRKDEMRKQIAKRRKLKERDYELDGLFCEMAKFQKISALKSVGPQPQYFDQMEKNMRVIEDVENDKKMIEIEKKMREVGEGILLQTKFNVHSHSKEKQNWQIHQEAYRKFMDQIEHLGEKYFDQESVSKTNNYERNHTDELISQEKMQASKLFEELLELKNGLGSLKIQQDRQSSGRQSAMTDRQSKLMDLLQGHQSKPNSARSK